MKIATVGLNLAKNVFQLHGIDADGRVVVRRRLRRSEVIKAFTGRAAVPRGHGGVRRGASLGAAPHQPGPRGPAPLTVRPNGNQRRCDGDFPMIAGPALDGTLMVAAADMRASPQAARVVARFRAQGYEPKGYTLNAYADCC